MKVIKLFVGVADTTTSVKVDIKGASRVVLVCSRPAHTSGTAVFTAKVGTNGIDADYKKWISNAANTNVQGETRVASLTLSGAGSDFITMSPEDCFDYMEVKATLSGTGTGSAYLLLDYTDDRK